MRRGLGTCVICKEDKLVNNISYYDSGVRAVAIGRSPTWDWHFCDDCLKILCKNKRIVDKYRENEYITS